MLRIHFSSEDLARTRIAGAPDPLWEIVLGLHPLRLRRTDPLLADWKREVLGKLAPGSRQRQEIEPLISINPPMGYFPDLLTPAEAGDGMEAGIEAILSLPKERLRDEIGRLARDSDTGDLALGRVGALTQLATAYRTFHEIAIEPIADRIRIAFEADRATRAQAFLRGGIGEVLNGLHPNCSFDGSVLELSDVTGESDLHLDGRGLQLVPCYFKVPEAKLMTLADPGLPQVLVYPVDRHAGLTSAASREPLSALLGRTRAALLEHTATGGSTGELARRLGVSAPAASQHLSVLREAGLVISVRDRNSMRHTISPLGRAILTRSA